MAQVVLQVYVTLDGMVHGDADLQLTSVGSKTLDSGVIDLRYRPTST